MLSPRMRWWPIVAFFCLAVVLRAPFWAVDVIDWDESTFILMGQSWADGDLPYTSLWDNKPPLCFLPFALVASLVGKSIAAVRLLGLASVVLTAIVVWRIGRGWGSERMGRLAGALCVVLVTFASRGQATMSETLAIAPLALGCAPVLLDRRDLRSAALSGACLSVATLIRFNLVFVAALALSLWLVRCRQERSARAAVAFVVASVSVVVATALPYAIEGEIELFVRSVVLAPFDYALAGVRRMLGASSVGGVTVGIAVFSRLPGVRPSNWPAFWLLAASVALSIVLSGGGSAHYWIQIHPFTALALAAGIVRAAPRLSPAMDLLVVGGLTFLAATLADASWIERAKAFRGLEAQGRARRLAMHLDAKGARGQPVVLFSDHLAHWWLESAPIHPILTHPSNAFRPELFRVVLGEEATSAELMRTAFRLKPLFVVLPRVVRHLDRAPEAAQWLEETLRQDYVSNPDFEGLRVFRRRSGG
ncbi:MAG: glycosyltransferase family 39 protein [Myxococcota bacterium]